jgi:hypothetical protein
MDQDKKEVPIDDEAELDKELAESINAVKAGNKLEETPTTPETKVEEKPAEKPADQQPDTKVEDPSNPQVAEDTDKSEFRIPNKGKFESDESYELRISLMDLVKRRKAATTPEAKAALSDEISKTKGHLKNLNGSDKIINPLNKVDDTKPVVDEDPAIKADRERLKQLGGTTREDVQEMVRQERLAQETQNALTNFVNRYAEFKDEDMRDVFFDFVDANYNWQGKTGKELITVLELARENMFRPSESIQERVIKGANVQEKINAMSFPGGNSGVGQGLSPELRRSVDELKATGMSEEKAIELLSE